MRRWMLAISASHEMKHYSGAMFYYGGEWYWGADRLYLLEQRLAALGVDRYSERDLIAPRPSIDASSTAR